MSVDNNNSSTHAPLLECHYRNKYEKWYWSLVEKIPSVKPLDRKTEEHHIVSKCLGGHKTDPSNLCYPTPRQHFVLHRLLQKMYPDHEGVWYAIFRMSCSGKSRTYETLKLNYVRSEEHNKKIAESLKGQRHSEGRKKNISEARKSSPNTPRGVEHPNCRKDIELRKEEIREIWLSNGKPGDIVLGKLIGLGTKKNGYRSKTLQRLIKEFKEEDIV